MQVINSSFCFTFDLEKYICYMSINVSFHVVSALEARVTASERENTGNTKTLMQ